MSVSIPPSETEPVFEIESDDDCVYTLPDGDEIPLYQPAWVAVELDVGGAVIITLSDWYAEDMPKISPAEIGE